MTTAIDIDKLKSGDREAFARFWEEIHAPLSRVVRRHTRGDLNEAEEIIQETAIDIFNRLDRLQDIDTVEKLKAITYRIARNKLMDFHRRAARRIGSDSLPDLPAQVAADLNPEVELLREEVELLREAMKSLTERERMVLEHRLQGKTFEELAITLGCSRVTLHNLWASAVARLYRILEQKGAV